MSDWKGDRAEQAMREAGKKRMAEAAKEAEEKKKAKFPDLGKIVKYDGEYGVIVLGDYGADSDEQKEEQVVRWDTKDEFDFEQYEGSPLEYEFIDKYDFEHINMDGTLKTDDND